MKGEPGSWVSTGLASVITCGPAAASHSDVVEATKMMTR